MKQFARISAVAVAMLPAALGLTATAATAQPIQHQDSTPHVTAGPYIGSNSGGAWLRNAAYLGDQYKVKYVYNGTAVRMICYVDTQMVRPPDSDYASARWFKVDAPSAGVYQAYVHSSLVEAQSRVGHC